MSANHFLTDEADFWTNCAVILPLLFLAVFSFWHKWWRDTYGRCLGFLAVAMFGSRLYSALQLWGMNDNWYRWIAVAALGVGPAVFLVLSYKLIRPHLPWIRRRHDALEDRFTEQDREHLRRLRR